MSLSRLSKAGLVIAGTLSLALGIVGAFLPVLPTTPFVLLAVICYVRSSERMYAWVMNSRFANKHVRGILAGHGIPLSVKIFSVTLSAFMIGYVCVVLTESFIVRLLLGVLFTVQVVFMARIKTMKKTDQPGHQSLDLETSTEA
jgi:uncharacterized membrane protein YbaN (DUF454 family)